MKIIVILLFVVGFGISDICTTTSNQDADSEIVYNYIQDSLKNYKPLIITTKDTTSWLKTYISKSYACMLDYNGNGRSGYALLLKDVASKSVFLFCLSVNDSTVECYKIDSFRINNVKAPDIEVSVYPKGIWESVDEKIHVRNDGILVENLYESLSFAYYYKDNRFIKFFFD